VASWETARSVTVTQRVHQSNNQGANTVALRAFLVIVVTVTVASFDRYRGLRDLRCEHHDYHFDNHDHHSDRPNHHRGCDKRDSRDGRCNHHDRDHNNNEDFHDYAITLTFIYDDPHGCSYRFASHVRKYHQ
jgi:hypothetical protein